MTDQVVERLRTSQVARAAGVNHETLRYYERRRLLASPDRSLGGHRLYHPDTVTVLRVIKAAQRLGFSLDEVAELLETGRHHHGHAGDRNLQDRLEAKLAEVEAMIADLTMIADTIRAAQTVGCDDPVTCATTPDCPLPFAELRPPSLCQKSDGDRPVT